MGSPDEGLARPRVRAAENLLEYDRGAVVESYVNDRRGLEQGITIASAPRSDGGPADTDGLVHLDLALGGTLSPLKAADGQAIDFATPRGSIVVHYAELSVRDARGRALRSWVEALVESGLPGIRIVYDDAGAAYPVTIDLLATNPAWTAESHQASAEFGYSVATAGDVNDDGYADVIVGARYYDNGQTDEGRAFVYLGGVAGLSTSPAWTAESDQANAVFGWSVATAGDVNGDGYDDVIVGARLYNNGQSDEGRAFVYLGSMGGLSTTPAWTAESNQVLGRFGYSVATAGDVNDDGYDDVVVGATGYTHGQTDEGRAYLYLGSALGPSTSPAWTYESNQASSNFGYSVGTAGDVNGDGYADVIVGAYQFTNGQADEGRAFVYYGSAAGLSTSPAWTAESDQAGALFGNSVGTAGDVNGDGYSDVIVGARSFDSGQTNEGRAYFYLGSAAGLSPSAGWMPESDQEGALFGYSVGTAGDVNGDGFADVIVGAYGYDNDESDEGRVFVYFGSAAGLQTSPAWTAESDQPDAGFGNAVGTAGDVNGDGYDDVIVGAVSFNNGQADEGRAHVYLGSAPDACVSGGAPIVCNDGDVCTTDTCNPATGCVFTDNTAPCDDGDACTSGDACVTGVCSGTPGTPPGEVDDGVRLAKSGGGADITWNVAPRSTTSDILRGELSGLPVGPGSGDELCLGNVGVPFFSDAQDPDPDAGFWYLIRGEGACGTGPYGYEGVGGVPTTPRVSTTCP